MPTLFDSHEEFNEWFSKDIESHAENKTSVIDQSEWLVSLRTLAGPAATSWSVGLLDGRPVSCRSWDFFFVVVWPIWLVVGSLCRSPTGRLVSRWSVRRRLVDLVVGWSVFRSPFGRLSVVFWTDCRSLVGRTSVSRLVGRRWVGSSSVGRFVVGSSSFGRCFGHHLIG